MYHLEIKQNYNSAACWGRSQWPEILSLKPGSGAAPDSG